MWNKKKNEVKSHNARAEASYPLAEWPLNHRYKSRVRFLTSTRALVPPFFFPLFFVFFFFFLLRCDKRRREDLLYRRIEKWLARFVNGKASGALKVSFSYRSA